MKTECRKRHALVHRTILRKLWEGWRPESWLRRDGLVVEDFYAGFGLVECLEVLGVVDVASVKGVALFRLKSEAGEALEGIRASICQRMLDAASGTRLIYNDMGRAGRAFYGDPNNKDTRGRIKRAIEKAVASHGIPPSYAKVRIAVKVPDGVVVEPGSVVVEIDVPPAVSAVWPEPVEPPDPPETW